MRGFRGKQKQFFKCQQCNQKINGRSHQKFCSKKCRVKFNYSLNKERALAYSAKYNAKRYISDVNYKLATLLRNRIYFAIKNNQKVGSAVDDLGCSVEELKKHLESKFEPGMSWNNWTIDGWHIDHIKPLASFDLTDPVQFREACNFNNLQPLWAKDNLSKGDSV